MKKLLLLLLILTVCCSACQSASVSKETSTEGKASTEISSPVENKTAPESSTAPASPFPVSEKRLSSKRFGESSVTQSLSGLYTLAQIGFSSATAGQGSEFQSFGSFALYCEKDSDYFSFLCGRPDCMHKDESCDAYLGKTIGPLGFYKDSLYYITQADALGANMPCLWKMDLDGRNKQVVTPLYSEDEQRQTVGIGFITFTDGFMQLCLRKLAENGDIISITRYCSLDKPSLPIDTAAELRHPQIGNGLIVSSDGEAILVKDFLDAEPSKDEDGTYMDDFLYAWNPHSNELAAIGERKNNSPGYYDKYSGAYMEDGVLMVWDYQTKSGKALFDTGLKGKHILYCYPDCFLVSEYIMPEDDASDIVHVYCYNWDMEYLGKCTIKFENAGWYSGVVMLETETRILFGDLTSDFLPLWYIEKSDFGKEEIPLHEYHYPEMELLE